MLRHSRRTHTHTQTHTDTHRHTHADWLINLKCFFPSKCTKFHSKVRADDDAPLIHCSTLQRFIPPFYLFLFHAQSYFWLWLMLIYSLRCKLLCCRMSHISITQESDEVLLRSRKQSRFYKSRPRTYDRFLTLHSSDNSTQQTDGL